MTTEREAFLAQAMESSPFHKEWDEMSRLTAAVANAHWQPIVQDEFLNRIREIYYAMERKQIIELAKAMVARKAVGT